LSQRCDASCPARHAVLRARAWGSTLRELNVRVVLLSALRA
jgi:hypothetical protein